MTAPPERAGRPRHRGDDVRLVRAARSSRRSRPVDGVDAAAVNLATRTATVRTTARRPRAALSVRSRRGYGARPHERGGPRREDERLPPASGRRGRPTVPILVLTFAVPRRPLGACGSRGSWRPRCSSTGAGRSSAPPPAPRVTGRRRWTRSSRSAPLAAYVYSAWTLTVTTGWREWRTTSTPRAVIITLILVGRLLEARARWRPATRARRCSNAAPRRPRSWRRRDERARPDRRAPPRQRRRRPAGREDPGRRRREGRPVVGGPVAAHRRVGARRRRARRRGRRRFRQRARPAGRVRDQRR